VSAQIKPHHPAAFLAALICAAILGLGLSYINNQKAHPRSSLITLAATSTTENSGLLAHLMPKFTARTGIEVHTIVFGTGQAIKNAERGDADVLFIHDTASEEKFVADGFALKRHDIMFNDFVIIGPKTDPANIKGLTNISMALKKIATSRQKFVSRGDDSGTHKAELRLWKKTGNTVTKTSQKWYIESGLGMGATLNEAIALSAYTLTDQATWAAFKNKANHEILVENEPPLHNQYGAIAVNPAKHSTNKRQEALAFINWLTGPDGQMAIRQFQIGGKQVFFPNAHNPSNRPGSAPQPKPGHQIPGAQKP